MEIKLIALDMDGTLLNEKKKFQKETEKQSETLKPGAFTSSSALAEAWQP